jgi:hypothetical protein
MDARSPRTPHLVAAKSAVLESVTCGPDSGCLMEVCTCDGQTRQVAWCVAGVVRVFGACDGGVGDAAADASVTPALNPRACMERLSALHVRHIASGGGGAMRPRGLYGGRRRRRRRRSVRVWYVPGRVQLCGPLPEPARRLRVHPPCAAPRTEAVAASAAHPHRRRTCGHVPPAPPRCSPAYGIGVGCCGVLVAAAVLTGASGADWLSFDVSQDIPRRRSGQPAGGAAAGVAVRDPDEHRHPLRDRRARDGAGQLGDA